MKINAAAAYFETPEKKDDDINTPEEEVKQRSAPSSQLKKMLLGLKRLHEFYHENGVVSIEDFRLSLKTRSDVRKVFIDFDDDLNDWIVKLEEASVENDKFTSFSKEYIHHEFLVEKELSFCVLILLSYMKMFSLSAEDAFPEVFNLSPVDSFCECCSDPSHAAEEDIIGGNLNYLRRVIVTASDVTEEEDDDTGDPDFDLNSRSKNHEEDSSETMSDSEPCPVTLDKQDEVVDDIVNPFASDNEESDVYKFVDEYSEKELNHLVVLRRKQVTNPFFSEDEEIEVGRESKGEGAFKYSHISKTSSVKKNHSHSCNYCERAFNSDYNLQMHQIAVHRIFPENRKIFECPECEFVTGSKTCYTRHATTHLRVKSKQKVKNSIKVRCRTCGVLFSNESSMKRHTRRRHKD